MNTEVVTPETGKVLAVSVGNLLPMDATSQVVELQALLEWTAIAEEVPGVNLAGRTDSFSSGTSGSSIDA